MVNMLFLIVIGTLSSSIFSTEKLTQLSPSDVVEVQLTTALEDYKAKNYDAAFKAFGKIAAQNHNLMAKADAQAALGRMYFFGEGDVKQDYAQAFQLFSQAAAQDVEPASKATGQYRLAEMYLGGLGVEIDQKKALELLELTGAQNDNPIVKADSEYFLAILKPHGAEATFKLLNNVIKNNNSPFAQAQARARLAEMYYYGKGTKKDFNKAFSLLRVSAIQDRIPSSQVLLGKIYVLGENNINVDLDMALQLFEQAYVQNKDIRVKMGAAHMLGLIYLSREKYDGKKAKEFLTISAHQDLLPDTKIESQKLLTSIATQQGPKKKKKKKKKKITVPVA